MTSLELPRDALEELFATWSGDGDLLGAVASSDQGEGWSPAEIRRRANRVLLGLVEAELRTWPSTPDEWSDHLPPAVSARRVPMRAPVGSVRWAETVRRHGWPPSAYVGSVRSRSIDEVSVSTLAWLVSQLEQTLVDVRAGAPVLHDEVSPIVAAARAALDRSDLQGHSVTPDRTVLRSLASSGAPWRSVSEVAATVQRARADLRFLAFELIEPDPAGRGALFHLCALGQVVRALRSSGFAVRWISSLNSRSGEPQAQATGRDGQTWDLWYEAGAAHRYYRLGGQLYGSAVRHVPGAGGSVGADIAIIQPGGRSLLLECKWSSKIEYVARSGFHQAASYALDMRQASGRETWSFVVGPSELIPRVSVAEATDLDVVVGSSDVLALPVVLAAFFASSPQALVAEPEVLAL